MTLNIFEISRNSLIKDGLIKDKPTSYCKPGWERKDPCYACNTDAMCTEMDFHTGQTKNTFYKGYKKEHRVRGKSDPDILIYRLGERIKLLTLVLASDFPGAMSAIYVT